MAGIPECQPAEDELLRDRREDDGIKDEDGGRVAVSGRLHYGIILYDPFRAKYSNAVNHKGRDILQSHCQKDNGGNRVETESGGIISSPFPEWFYKYVLVPDAEQDQCGDTVYKVDRLRKVRVCLGGHQTGKQRVETAAFSHVFNSIYDHHRDRDSKLEYDHDEKRHNAFKKVTGFFHNYSSYL